MLTYILSQPKMTEEVAAEGPYAVIMAPTRELAQQVQQPLGLPIQNIAGIVCSIDLQRMHIWQGSAFDV